MPTFRRLAWFMDRVPYRNAERVRSLLGGGRWLLDVGGGTGRVASRFGESFERIVVADIERNMLLRAKARGLDAVLADARRLPFRAGLAEAALAVDAFHHFPDPPAVLSEMRRVVSPAGRVVIEEFDPRSLGGRLIERFEALLRFGSRFHAPDALAALARDAGMETEIHALSAREYALVARRKE